MKRSILIYLLLLCNLWLNAQVKRSYHYCGVPIEALAWNNKTENNFGFPGMNAYIIISDNPSLSLTQTYNSDELHLMPVSGMNDYTCFYYLKSDYIPKHALKTFLTSFIDWCYKTDHIDRNSVHLVWQCATTTEVSCSAFENLDSIISSIHVLSDSANNNCGQYFTSSQTIIWQKSKSAKTVVKYQIPTLMEMEEQEEQERKKAVAAAYSQKKGDVYFQLTVGRHEISNAYKTSFDTSTLVDFTKFKTLWNIHTGYYFTRHLALDVDVAFIYSGKKKKVDSIDWSGNAGITVSGSGYAGAMVRYGIGLNWLIYSRNCIDININLSCGKLTAIAGGGSGTKIIGGGSSNLDVTRQKRQTNYGALMVGTGYRLSNTIYFTGNVQYNLSGFDQSIGSVSAFTGWSLNLGLGLSIPTKNKINEKK